MESHTGPKYKLTPSLRLGFPSLAGGLNPPLRPAAEGSTPGSGPPALAVLCPGPSARVSPWPPQPVLQRPGRGRGLRSNGEAAVGPPVLTPSPPQGFSSLSQGVAQIVSKLHQKWRGGKERGETAG